MYSKHDSNLTIYPKKGQNESNMTRDSSLHFLQVSEPVPEGVNIFNIFNISAPGNVTLLENWVVLVNPNSTVYQQIRGQFEVREGGGLGDKVTQISKL